MLNSTLTSFLFDVRRLEIFDIKIVSILQFLIFPYSILIASIITMSRKIGSNTMNLGYRYNDHGLNQGSQTRGPREGPMRPANIMKNEDF